MSITRRNFAKGVMNKDIEDRLLPDGMFRDALNINVSVSEGSEAGAVQNSLSNKILTDINFGTDIFTTGYYADEFRDKLYWLVKSSTGCYLMEWDDPSQTVAFVLADTRPIGQRVFNLSENFLCTGFEKIINDDIEDDLILLTEDNLPPLCFNVERAKSYGVNGFQIEDLCLIKKPPRFAPTAVLSYSKLQSNNIEEKFLSFSYRYQYLDNEWSALSSYTNYKFSPNPYSIDYYTLDNLGMVNAFNAIILTINTGDKRVKAVQIVFKESNSNALYVVETFDKKKEKWLDNSFKNYTFSNNKIYTILPERELGRAFDNVPLKAKSLALIGNRPVFGNYLEGFDIAKADGTKIKLDYTVNVQSKRLNTNNKLTTAVTGNGASINSLEITNTTFFALNKNNKITLRLVIRDGTSQIFNQTFSYDLPRDFASLQELFQYSDFEDFITIVSDRFVAQKTYIIPNGLSIDTEPELQIYTISQNVVGLKVSVMVLKDNSNNLTNKYFNFADISIAYVTELATSASCKSNRDYEVATEYLDPFNRKTIALTTANNSVYIENQKSEYKNNLQIILKNPPPAFADRFKIVVKTPALNYYTITVNQFYQDGAFVWVKLEGVDKDKVKLGEYLILKSSPGKVEANILKTKILEVGDKGENFIANTPISEPAGLYFKIKPTGFNMIANQSSFRNAQAQERSVFTFPVCYLSLFYTGSTGIELKAGSNIKLKFDCSFDFDDGWASHIFEKNYPIQRDYTGVNGIIDWYNEIVLGTSMPGGRDGGDYKDNVQLIQNSSGEWFLAVKGFHAGDPSTDRGGFVNAWIEIRESKGDYIFETEPKKNLDDNLFYETEQTFEIINGQHQGNVQNQDLVNNLPVIIDLDFFNCFAQGNNTGVESYIIKDSFNKPFLNIDTRPTTTSTEEYKQVRRFADLIYGEPFVESTNKNGLNEFNITTANFKELDKNFGSIQKILSRDNDLVVLQEEKASKVMYGKDVIYNADGSFNVGIITDVLGKQITYLGENGVSKNPESVAVYDFQIYYTNARRGVIQRLSIDGVTDIVNGMIDYFRDLFIAQPTSKKLGGFDPYFKQYVLSVSDEVYKVLQLKCGNIISKSNVTEAFTYILNTNKVTGDILLQYNISLGSATITADFDGGTTVVSNVNGTGVLTIPVTNSIATVMIIVITPTTPMISFNIDNICPIPRHYSKLHYNSNHYST